MGRSAGARSSLDLLVAWIVGLVLRWRSLILGVPIGRLPGDFTDPAWKFLVLLSARDVDHREHRAHARRDVSGTALGVRWQLSPSSR